MTDVHTKKTILAVAWSAGERFSVQGFQFIISIILARLITPDEYGLMGIVLVFIVFSDLLINSGFSQALIQKKTRTEIDYTSVFYFNIIIGILLYIFIYISSPYISSFYKQEALTQVLRVVSLVMLIKPLYLVQMTILSIRLDFKLRTKINFVSALISGILAAILAFRGFGIYALVWQQLLKNLFIAILSFTLIRWFPRFAFSFLSIKQLFHFGYKLLLSGVIRSFVDNGYAILMGKILPIKDVGFYTQGRNIPDLISMNLFTILQNVFFPVMSEIQDERDKLIAFYKKGLEGVAFIIIPVMVGLMLIAEPFVHLFLTAKWDGAIVVMQWIALSRLIIPLSALNSSLINSIGRSDAYLRVDLAKLPITIGALFVTVPFGLHVVVIGNAVVSFLCFFINAYYPGKWFGLGAFVQLKIISKIILATIIMSVSLYFIQTDSPLLEIVLKVILGSCIYYMSCLLLKVGFCVHINKYIYMLVLKQGRKGNL
ncbi:TPA: lipopolysaccharide biosynthesis protein [Klebsiella aerogenes]